MLLTSQVISVAFYSEREKSYKFCSEDLISAWGSFTCRKLRSGTHGFTSLSKEVILRIFTLWKIHRPRLGLNSRTSYPVASIITTGPPGWIHVIRWGYCFRFAGRDLGYQRLPSPAAVLRATLKRKTLYNNLTFGFSRNINNFCHYMYIKSRSQHGGWRWQPLISQVPAGKSKAIPSLQGGLQLSKNYKEK